MNVVKCYFKVASNSGIREASLNFTGNELGITGATSFGQIISSATNISSLILRGCEFKKDGLSKIAEALGQVCEVSKKKFY